MISAKEEIISPMQLTVFLFTVKLPLLILYPFSADAPLSISHWLVPVLAETLLMLAAAVIAVELRALNDKGRLTSPRTSAFLTSAAGAVSVYYSVLYLYRLITFCGRFSPDEISEVFIIISLLIVCSFAAGKGIEAVFRFSGIVFVLIITASLIAAVFLFPIYDNSLLSANDPLTERTLAKNAALMFSESPEIMLLLYFSSFTRNSLNKAAIYWAIGEGLFMLFMLILICGATGSYTNNMQFPLYRMTDASGSLQRLSPLFIGMILSSFICFLSSLLYIVKRASVLLAKSRKNSAVIYYPVLAAVLIMALFLTKADGPLEALYDTRVMLAVLSLEVTVIPLTSYIFSRINKGRIKKSVSACVLVLSIIIAAFVSSGCGASQLDQRLIIQGIGIDKGDSGSYTLTMIILDTDPGKDENAVRIKCYEGESVAGTFRNSEYISGKRPLLSQCLFIMMNKAASEKPEEVLGYFTDSREMIKTANIMASRDNAGETIKKAVNKYKYHSEDINVISDSRISDQPVPHFTLFDYISKRNEGSQEMILPLIETDDKTSSLICRGEIKLSS